MANRKSNTDVAAGAMPNVKELQHAAPVSTARPNRIHPPLRYKGGNLGLGDFDYPSLMFVDAHNVLCETSSVEWALRNLELFQPGLDQARVLADAAMHYGLDAFALMGADLGTMADVWDVYEASGRLLLGDVPYHVADAAAERQRLAGNVGEITIRLRRRDGHGDPRHEGPLVLLHHNLGITSFQGVAVKSHIGRCGMMLEEALRRFDQFGPADQRELLAGLAKHFDLGGASSAAARRLGVAA